MRKFLGVIEVTFDEDMVSEMVDESEATDILGAGGEIWWTAKILCYSYPLETRFS